MMKKLFIVALSLLLPVTAFAAPTSWDLTSGVLQPLQNAWSAVVKGDHFQATSTNASIFPNATSTLLTVSGSEWLTGISGSTQCLHVNASGLVSGTGVDCGSGGSGGVTSVNASGGTTGLTFSGGPITTSGTLTLAGTLGVANGGTGSTTLTGLLKGNGTGQVQTAVAGTDYAAPGTYITALTGDVTATGPGSAAATLATVNGNVGSFTYPSVTVNGKGLITAISSQTPVTSFNTRTGAVTISSSDVTTGLGFTPFGGTNPLPVANGGTASTTLSGILIGNGTSAVNTLTIGSGLSLTGTTLSATGSGSGTVGSGTTGQFPYYAANGTTLTATSSLFLAATGNVGVSTTSPWAQLSVGMASSTPSFIVGTAGSSSPAFYVSSANGNGFTGFGTSVPDSPITIDMNTVAPPVLGAFTGTTIHTVGADGLANRLVQDSFGAATVYSLRRADGTGASPTALANADNVFTFGGAGYTGAAYSSTKAQFNMVTTQAWTTTANGIGFNWLVTPNNSTTLFTAMMLDNTGNLGLGTTTPLSLLQLATTSASTLPGGAFGQLTLTDTGGGTNLKHWLFTSEKGNFYLGTTSDKYATGTPDISIDTNGQVGIGTSTPASALTVVANALGGILINTWTNIVNAFTIKNSSGTTVFNIDTTATNPFLGIGTSTPWATISAVGDGTDPILALATSTAGVSSKPIMEYDVNGLPITSGPRPTISSCGTSSFGDSANNKNGLINLAGTALTACTVTFSPSWASAPDCTVSDNTTASVADITSISSSQIVFGLSVGITSAKIWYQCTQNQ